MTSAITDFSQYAELRYGAAGNDREVLREVAGQFEALFVEMMLKNMRESSLGDPLLGDSDQQEIYNRLHDQQLAVEVSSRQGIGLAEMLVRQLGGEHTVKSPSASTQPISMAGSTDRHDIRSGKTPWTDAESFARDVWPHAKRVARQLNISPQAVLAQAALETGWGQHVLPAKDGEPSNNLFGIKAGRTWDGATVTRSTIEFEHGVAQRQAAQFRSYDGVAETFDDYVNLLTQNPRYASIRDHGNDIDAFANALQESGYATDPAYAEKISRVANSRTMNRVMTSLKVTNGLSIKD